MFCSLTPLNTTLPDAVAATLIATNVFLLGCTIAIFLQDTRKDDCHDAPMTMKNSAKYTNMTEMTKNAAATKNTNVIVMHIRQCRDK